MYQKLLHAYRDASTSHVHWFPFKAQKRSIRFSDFWFTLHPDYISSANGIPSSWANNIIWCQFDHFISSKCTGPGEIDRLLCCVTFELDWLFISRLKNSSYFLFSFFDFKHCFFDVFFNEFHVRAIAKNSEANDRQQRSVEGRHLCGIHLWCFD